MADRTMLSKWRENFALLRRAANEIGPEFERMSYEQLCRPAEEISGERDFEGVRVYFSAEAYGRDRHGNLHFCIDVTAKIPTLLGIKPSYHFVKRPDGSVFY